MGGWWVVVGGWTKTKLMLFSTQVDVVVELKLELSLAKFDNCRTQSERMNPTMFEHL